MEWVRNHPTEFGIAVAVIIVVLGLFVYGFADLAKFTPKRIWAVSGVVFRESIRRKILWLTPLAMFGIVILTGLQEPDDGADAIRQTLQFCLFASGLLVVISAVMLSCTNLPRDIDSKVIFTIVTKPITRLEIVAGKIVGFARVTGSILILMGLFTWGYLHVRAWNLGKGITAQLSTTLENEFARGRLEHQQREGLLDTRSLARTNQIDFLARESAPNSSVRWISTQQSFFVPFRVEPQLLVPQGFHDPAKGEAAPNPGDNGVIVRVKLTAEQIGKVERQAPTVRAPLAPLPDQTKNPYGEAEFFISIISTETEAELVPSSSINNGNPFEWTPAQYGTSLDIRVDPKIAPALAQTRDWAVIVTPANENYLLGMSPGDVSVIVPGATAENNRVLESTRYQDSDVAVLVPRGSNGRSGRMLEGPKENHHSIAVAHFDGPAPKPSDKGTVTLEMTMNIDRLEDDASIDATIVEVQVANRTTGQLSDKFRVTPENARVAYADIPGSAFEGGKFDVTMRVITRGHAVSLSPSSISVVQARSSFALNLVKSMFSQWMLSILVVVIGLFCSTIVSWPIAIVLCVVLLMGRWAVDQVSDSLQPGIGALLATDMGAKDATQARVISAVGDGLARMLNLLSQFLPNIDVFSTGGLLERGLAIPFRNLGSGLAVLLLFGLPIFTLAYIRLRNKEVAP
jgi:hypothetical protein